MKSRRARDNINPFVFSSFPPFSEHILTGEKRKHQIFSHFYFALSPLPMCFACATRPTASQEPSLNWISATKGEEWSRTRRRLNGPAKKQVRKNGDDEEPQSFTNHMSDVNFARNVLCAPPSSQLSDTSLFVLLRGNDKKGIIGAKNLKISFWLLWKKAVRKSSNLRLIRFGGVVARMTWIGSLPAHIGFHPFLLCCCPSNP